jgi:hypothetical protein
MLYAALLPLVAVAGWAVHRSGAPREDPTAEPPGGPKPPVIASGAAPGIGPPSPGRPSAMAPGKAAGTVRYTFDGGLDGPVDDIDRRLPLTARRGAGGALIGVAHDGGLAVRFPAACEHYGAESCARAILQSGPANFLNPGRGAFAYGASVLVKANETSKGANVVQKGFSVGDSQFKLQVDGAAGEPSCVIVGTGSETIHVALASRSVADSRWHRVVCSHGNALLTVAVDGAVVGHTAIPSSLSIANDDPLCIGGKGISANNDQFAGVIDDVFITRIA